jgi:hypothetical protein
MGEMDKVGTGFSETAFPQLRNSAIYDDRSRFRTTASTQEEIRNRFRCS